MNVLLRTFASVVAVAIALMMAPSAALAHCDTVSGPVVTAAKEALGRGDVTPVLKWIKPDYEAEIRAAFQQALKVRSLSPEARALADNYFFETLVRVHREGEGEPYTGLKTSPAEPGIAAADAAMANGSAEELVRSLSAELAAGIRQRFHLVQQAREHAGDNVDAGRQFIAAYVQFIHYIEGLHEQVNGSAAHSMKDVAEAEPHQR